MTAAASAVSTGAAAPAAHAALRRLFLMLFLRGRTSRGLDTSASPRSIASKLWVTLGLYTLFGASALAFLGQTVFVLAASLHAMTFLLLGMFVAASAGEVLFNKEEGDILLHRPVPPRALLWAKIRVLAEVSLWLAGALNLVAFVVGAVMPRGAAWFPLVHAVSIVMEALFCTGCVVLAYQLCLRWFGREVLDGMMTASQVVVGVALTVGSQVVPQVIGRLEGIGGDEPLTAWWLGLLPPVWFAAFDEVATVGGRPGSWGLAGLAVAATATVLWLAVGKLSREYERGLQGLGEGSGQPQRTRSMRRSLEWLVDRPPLAWILRDSVARASFLLTARYLFRDRDVMLRMYPGLAPILVMPFVFMLGPARRSGAGLVLTSGFLGLIPMTGLSLMRYSQNFQAADVFRAAPLTGPARLCHGARWAMLTVLTVPMLVIFGTISWLFNRSWSEMAIFLPGLMLMPIFSLVPCLDGRAVPLSVPGEEAKAASRSARMFAIAIISSAIGGLGMLARRGGWLWQLLAVEALVVAVVYVFMRRRVAATQWPSLE